MYIGYRIWSSDRVESLRDSVDPRAGVEDQDEKLTPLWFVPDPHNPRRLFLDAKQQAIIKNGLGVYGVIHHAIMTFSTGDKIALHDVDYSVNGKREGSVLLIDPQDEALTVAEADTRGSVNESGLYGNAVGLLVLVDAGIVT